MVIVPVMYGIMSRHGERNKKKSVIKQFQFME
jgi:hydrophobic/amphiphilic exporter-1 (mainly G- bacteria), HAE1 family